MTQARSVPLGRWAGFPVRAHWSALLLVALVADIVATAALPGEVGHRSQVEYWTVGVATAFACVGTVLAHELGHALVARRNGMTVRSVTLWVFGALTELDGEPPSPKVDLQVALAGPAVTFVIALAASGAATAMPDGVVRAALVWLAAMSVVLFVFNLLPAAPLDGGAALRAMLWRRNGDRAAAVATEAKIGRALGVGLIALGFLEVIAGAATGLWLAFIGWFVLVNARAASDVGNETLRGLRAADVMAPATLCAPEWWTVPQLLSALDPASAQQSLFPVVAFDGTVSGSCDLRDLERVPVVRRDETRIRQICGQPLLVRQDASLGEFAADLRLHRNRAVVVDDDRRPVGVITSDALARARLVDSGA
jgi:Zn-dependent protease/CBS domain-containing protein